MMVFLPFDTWYRLIAWLMIGLDIYLIYGISKSKLGGAEKSPESFKKSSRTVAIVGLVCTVLFLALVFIEFMLHTKAHETDPVNNLKPTLPYFAMAFCVIHVVVYGMMMNRKPKQA
jgi:basic amino acid/polyamine antiporter, APA family